MPVVNAIPVGVTVTILQNVVYALPTVSVEISTTAALESAITEALGFTAFTSGIVNGCFIRCTTGNATVRLRKNGVG